MVTDKEEAATHLLTSLKINSCWLTDTFATRALAQVIRSEKSSEQDYFGFQLICVAMRSEISG